MKTLVLNGKRPSVPWQRYQGFVPAYVLREAAFLDYVDNYIDPPPPPLSRDTSETSSSTSEETSDAAASDADETSSSSSGDAGDSSSDEQDEPTPSEQEAAAEEQEAEQDQESATEQLIRAAEEADAQARADAAARALQEERERKETERINLVEAAEQQRKEEAELLRMAEEAGELERVRLAALAEQERLRNESAEQEAERLRIEAEEAEIEQEANKEREEATKKNPRRNPDTQAQIEAQIFIQNDAWRAVKTKLVKQVSAITRAKKESNVSYRRRQLEEWKKIVLDSQPSEFFPMIRREQDLAEELVFEEELVVARAAELRTISGNEKKRKALEQQKGELERQDLSEGKRAQMLKNIQDEENSMLKEELGQKVDRLKLEKEIAKTRGRIIQDDLDKVVKIAAEIREESDVAELKLNEAKDAVNLNKFRLEENRKEIEKEDELEKLDRNRPKKEMTPVQHATRKNQLEDTKKSLKAKQEELESILERTRADVQPFLQKYAAEAKKIDMFKAGLGAEQSAVDALTVEIAKTTSDIGMVGKSVGDNLKDKLFMMRAAVAADSDDNLAGSDYDDW